ncbi:MAG TPA: PQQ-dependent sugar dehydrogenase [Pyrinomonadaceae bacterium]|jgi:glucose/arabinose dehydrogenase|nr:PQQ-dependent sugar dehydrogenase [Pyrinomonadaceae bacterium]
MRRTHHAKLFVVSLFAALGALALLTDSPASRRVYARSTGPDPGFTGAPGEFRCDDCHVFDGAPSGTINVGAPQSYAPGQTYAITVNEANQSPTRQRWGFQLTAVDDDGNRAGTLQAGADGRTQVIAGVLGNPARQYVEHTQDGTSVGQSNGTSWTFNWTAPAADVGPVTFYTAGNQANNDGNTSGDSINFTFVVVQPAAAAGDFNVNVSPSSQVIVPGASGAYTVTVTPTNGFTGTVNLSAAGMPAGAAPGFNPSAVTLDDGTARTSTLTVTNNSSTPLGSFPLTVTGAAGLLSHAAGATLVTGPTMTDANLTVRQVVAGLSQPTTLAFLGDGDFLILEKASGKVLRVTDGVVQATPVVDLAVNNNSERGLLGVALHPNFPTSPRVYLYWTESASGADSSNADDVPLLGNRVDSFLWNGATLALEKNLIRLRALQQDAGQSSRGNHNGGIIRFGPDGKLYVVIGDNGRRGMLQNLRFGPSASPDGPAVADDQFGGPEPDNAHLTGVILRLNDDGTTPTDNPFFGVNSGLSGEAAANVRKVFGYGVRNSFGMAFDPVSGYLWTQENGDDAFDEINRVVPGFNGGWVQLIGPSSRVAEYKQIESSRAGGLQQNRWTPDLIADMPAQALSRLFVLPGSRYTEPLFSWKFAVAPSPVGFVRGRGLGPAFENDLLVGASRTTLAGGYLFRFKLTDDRADLKLATPQLADRVADNNDKFDLTESETLLIGRDFGITTDIQTAPGGNVYVVSNSNGAIYEISAKPSAVRLAAATLSVSEGAARVVVDVTRSGDTSGTAAVDYETVDDTSAVRCDAQGTTAYPRCDYASARGTLNFAPGQTQASFVVPVTDDIHVENPETFAVRLLSPAGVGIVAPSNTTVTITDNDDPAAPVNPIYTTGFFVRQHYLDFLSREPEPGEPWSAVLNGCPDPFNTSASSPSANCDRIKVSSAFFGSDEFKLKGFFAFRFYKVAFGRLPRYTEIVADMAGVTATTTEEVRAKKAQFTNSFVQRQEFSGFFDSIPNAAFVDGLMSRYSLQQITTPDPASPDGPAKVVLTRGEMLSRLNQQSLTRAQLLRAIADSDEVGAAELNPAFVAMQYYGYLRRDPEEGGYNDWLRTIDANPADIRSMVNGFMNSTEYALRFGPLVK